MSPSDKYPNGPPKTHEADVDLSVKLGLVGADHHHHARELVEEIVEVMAQNTPAVLDVQIKNVRVHQTNDIVCDE